MSESWREVGRFSTELSLAVRLIDAVTGGRPVGEPDVRVDGTDARPIRNRSGYYLFFDLPSTSVTVTVDGGERYHDAETTVELDPDADDTHDTGEAVEISLSPTASYPFPSGMTVVRGTVLDGGTPVPGATVTVVDHSITVETPASGEYFYYFEGIVSDDIERVDPKPDDPSNVVKRYYKPDGSHPTFEVDGPPGQFQTAVEVEVGKLTTVDLTY